jgi:pilus assembly protein Flp/PilA
MKTLMKRFAGNKSGATAIEYGLIAALIAVVIIGGASAVGTSLNDTFTSISGSLGGATGEEGGDE